MHHQSEVCHMIASQLELVVSKVKIRLAQCGYHLRSAATQCDAAVKMREMQQLSSCSHKAALSMWHAQMQK